MLIRIFVLCVLVIALLISLIVLTIKIVVATQDIKFSLTSEAISGLFGLFGVIVGVLLTNYYNNISQRQQKKREIIKEYVKLYSDITLYLKRFRKVDKQSDDKYYNELESLGLEIFSKLGTLNVDVWDTFKSTRIKASQNRLFSSIEIIQNEVLNKTPLNLDLLNTSIIWIDKQWNEVLPMMMKAAKVPGSQKKLVFVGFRKVTALDKAELKFDVKQPPWIPQLELNFTVTPSEEVAKKISDKHMPKYKKLKCTEHGFAPYVIFSAYSYTSKWEVAYITCCENFLDEIKKVDA